MLRNSALATLCLTFLVLVGCGGCGCNGYFQDGVCYTQDANGEWHAN